MPSEKTSVLGRQADKLITAMSQPTAEERLRGLAHHQPGAGRSAIESMKLASPLRSILRHGLVVVLIALILTCSAHSTPPALSGTVCQTQAFFSRDAAPALIQALQEAKQSIRVAMYGLTSRGIVDALIAAKRRGVDVAIKTDKTQTEGKAQSALIVKLHGAGVPVEVSTQQRHLHHKFAVIDGQMAREFEREWQSIQQDAP